MQAFGQMSALGGNQVMLFNSFEFLVFFPIVLMIYFIIPKKIRYIWLLLASYFFYMCWNAEYALLLLASTVTTYGAGLLIARWKDKPKHQKAMVAISLIINFGILFFFKYAMFVVDTLEKVLSKAGIVIEASGFDILLPVGISFYIFQAVGYTMDVYHGKISTEKNLLRYALFVSFFPQLVAGPIERSTNLLPQLQNVHKINVWQPKRIQEGAIVMLYGYILKMIIADRAAVYVDTIYDVNLYNGYTGFTVLIAIILFSFQIYCDFAGYTYIAIGAAKIMGFDLMNNFRMPYMATSIKDFWSRWHISLTSWFRDYLYFPLGGSRKGILRKYINIFIVFLVSGLWHGAAWHFVLWGAIHGVMRVVGETTSSFRDKIYKKLHFDRDTLAVTLWKMFCTFSLVSFAWVFFRGESIRQSIDILLNVFREYNPWVLTNGSLFTHGLDAKEWNVLLVFLLFLIVTDVLKYCKINLVELFMKQNLWFRWLVFYVGIMAVVLFGVYGPQYDAAQFIYFQF